MADDRIEDNVKFDDDSDKEIIAEEESDFQEIISYAVSNSVRTIINMIDDGTIDLKPEFQRDFVWDMRRASKLIDSLLCNLPIPNTLLGKYKKTEKFIVIDGQQRLKTISKNSLFHITHRKSYYPHSIINTSHSFSTLLHSLSLYFPNHHR